ncbi:MAG: hypothetical protein WCJ29_01070 [bacterium]
MSTFWIALLIVEYAAVIGTVHFRYVAIIDTWKFSPLQKVFGKDYKATYRFKERFIWYVWTATAVTIVNFIIWLI